MFDLGSVLQANTHGHVRHFCQSLVVSRIQLPITNCSMAQMKLCELRSMLWCVSHLLPINTPITTHVTIDVNTATEHSTILRIKARLSGWVSFMSLFSRIKLLRGRANNINSSTTQKMSSMIQINIIIPPTVLHPIHILFS